MEGISVLAGTYNSFYRALAVNERSVSIASSNIANADTPGYKAKAIDFKQAFNDAEINQSLLVSKPRHIQSATGMAPDVKYRDNPVVRADGNSVNMAVEQMDLKRSTQNYEMALTVLKGKKSALSQILGER